ncbi:MAG: DNA photolyase [Acidobacteria bacterium]|nr:DNA photolyase [Acidobacteriota bacterium]
MKLYRPEKIYVDPAVADEPVTRYTLRQARDLPVVYFQSQKQLAELYAGDTTLTQGKKQLILTRHPGRFLKTCQGCTNCRVHCHYLTVTYATNCHLECTYCILQAYLNNPFMRVYANLPELLAELDAAFAANPDGVYRVGTGELSDSLGLDHLTGIARWMVPFFSGRKNAVLELKTKTDNIANLLEIEGSPNTVISWSINTAAVSSREEWKTATLEEKFRAARRCAGHGYRLGFHFDPMVHYDDWERDYRAVVEALFDRIDTRQIAWLSLGALRFHKELRDVIRWRFPRSRILDGEIVRGTDSKYQYFKQIRVEMYARMMEWIRRRSSSVAVYLCMESPDVHRKVFGSNPSLRAGLGRYMDERVLVTIRGA